jgi:hypothetical protein
LWLDSKALDLVMQGGVELLCLYFQEVRPLPLLVRTPCFSLQAVAVGGHQLTQEITRSLPHLAAIAGRVRQWLLGAAEEAQMEAQEELVEQQVTQIKELHMGVQQVAVDTWAMGEASMVEGLLPTAMQPREGSRLLVSMVAWEDIQQLWGRVDVVVLVVVAQEIMLEEVVGVTVAGTLVRQAIDAEGVEAGRTTSMAPHLRPHSTASGTLPCMGLFLPISLLDTA